MNTDRLDPKLKAVLIGGIGALVIFFTVLGVRLWRTANPPAEVSDPTAGVAAPKPAAPGIGAGAPTLSTPAMLEQKWGIEVVGVHLAVGGRTLDLRYKVLDVAKATALPKQEGDTFIIDEATGTRLAVPKTARAGSLRQAGQQLKAGRTYTLLFPNPGGRLRSGNQLTLVMGDFRAEHLVVQ